MGLFSVKVPEPDYGELWQTYQTWQAEDEQRYKQSKAQATARMAASGMRRNTDQWRNTLAQFDADYSVDICNDSVSFEHPDFPDGNIGPYFYIFVERDQIFVYAKSPEVLEQFGIEIDR